jgi:hypothetical protein
MCRQSGHPDRSGVEGAPPLQREAFVSSSINEGDGNEQVLLARLSFPSPPKIRRRERLFTSASLVDQPGFAHGG